MRTVLSWLSGRASRLPLRWFGRALDTHVALPMFALLPLTAIWIATFHFVHVERNAAIDAALDATREQVDTYEAQAARNLTSIDQTLKVIKYSVEMNGPHAALSALSRQALLPPGLVFQVSISDANGHIVDSNPVEGPTDVASQPYFIGQVAADSHMPFISTALADTTKTDPRLHFTRRINDASGHFAGIAIVEVDPAYFTSSYERARAGEHGLLALVGSDGVARALRIGDKMSWGQQIKLDGLAERAITRHAVPPDGMLRYIGARHLNGFPVTAVVGLSVDEQMVEFEHHRRTYFLAAMAASALLIVVVAIISAWSWQLAKSRRRERRAQETYRAASEASLDAFFVLRSMAGADGCIYDFLIEGTNSHVEIFTGLSQKVLNGKVLGGVLPCIRVNGIFDQLVRVTTEHIVLETEWFVSTGPASGRWLQRQIVPVEGGAVGMVRDITERKLAEERIRHIAHHDELTGLPNRILLRERLEHTLTQAQQDGRHLALIFIDLDDFKLVNDGLGHNAGDMLLQIVGQRMQSRLGRSDTLGRLGGDEFVVLLPNVVDSHLTLTPLLEQLRQAVTESVHIGAQVVHVTCSMGVALYPRDGVDPTTLMMNADAAMYRAKDLGSNNFQFYTPEMNSSMEEKLWLLEGLRQALDATLAQDAGGAASFVEKGSGRFNLLYQPKVDLRSGKVFGVEALIRWQHPELGMVPPSRFISLAEESGLIIKLGEWVMRTACLQAQAWRTAGLDPLIVSVNVSARQFEEQHLVNRIADALRQSGLPPSALEVEVTESLLMRDLPSAVERMRKLKSMGVLLSIDDFGTGYSSLSALKSFPISTLKIDKSFVQDLAKNSDDQAIALAVISLGHRLHLRVIAEGVETVEQRDFLRANGCDEMQGYLFSPPIDAERIVMLLQR